MKATVTITIADNLNLLKGDVVDLAGVHLIVEKVWSRNTITIRRPSRRERWRLFWRRAYRFARHKLGI